MSQPRARAAADRSPVLLALALGGCYLLALMLWPFLPAIVTSAVLAVLVHPAFRWFRVRVRPQRMAALLATIIVFFLGLIPLIGVSLLLLDQLEAGIVWMSGGATDLLSPQGRVARVIALIAERLGLEPSTLMAALSTQVQQLAATLAARTMNLFTGLGGWLLQAGVALFTMYYLLRDGERLVEHMIWLVPLETEVSRDLFRRANEVTHATIFGSLVVAVAQGTLGGLAFWAVGLPAPIVWATVMGLLSLLPAVGAFLVWAPAGVLLLLGGQPVRGLALLAFGTLLISTIDNVLRALLVSDRTQLHPLVVFFSVLGGLFVFGAVGVFVGPVLFVIALTVIEMARHSMIPVPAAGAGPA